MVVRIALGNTALMSKLRDLCLSCFGNRVTICIPIYGAAEPPLIRWPNGPPHKQRVIAPCSTLDSSGRHLLTVQGFKTLPDRCLDLGAITHLDISDATRDFKLLPPDRHTSQKHKRRVRGSWLKGQDLPTEAADFSKSTGFMVENC